MSIRIRFILVIGIMSLAAIGAFAYLSYSFTYNTALAEAKQKGDIVSSFLAATRSFYRNEQRPLIMDIVHEDRFYPTIMSGFAVTRGVWDQFNQKLPNYKFKQATLDPLYPPNKADADEIRLIAEFENNKGMVQKEGVMEKNGEKFFYYAEPIEIDKQCLRCHGDPKNAPKDQQDLYGTANGYGWKAGSIVSAYITYVPIQNAVDAAKKSAIMLFAYGFAGIVVLSLVIWFFFEKKVVSPITELEKRASEISIGKNLHQKIELISNDEIGSLGTAIERLRISVIKLIDRYTK
ncbi:methyl-accepting chemotaxis protein [Desulforhopalus sp. IMCC35007]|uniref:methyl-accepting chemotaxis protein n=1 Tax=Desulforhopalus sp. IMCC35007 TaxID=2569543 RepID=UPI0010ADB64E|nr:methyl-accepting chemotaxis protein [Desulforhopalus sp. IMCC35007]TKB10074.1 DUF3365 domain-containing protein [Desulforhopalus sp. IMCC35007]